MIGPKCGVPPKEIYFTKYTSRQLCLLSWYHLMAVTWSIPRQKTSFSYGNRLKSLVHCITSLDVFRFCSMEYLQDKCSSTFWELKTDISSKKTLVIGWNRTYVQIVAFVVHLQPAMLAVRSISQWKKGVWRLSFCLKGSSIFSRYLRPS